MELNKELVEKLADLARLDLADGEAERYVAQLGEILAHFEEIAALDTEGVPPTAHPFSRGTVTRPDEPAPSLPREKALANAPDPYAGAFRVPRVL